MTPVKAMELHIARTLPVLECCRIALMLFDLGATVPQPPAVPLVVKPGGSGLELHSAQPSHANLTNNHFHAMVLAFALVLVG